MRTLSQAAPSLSSQFCPSLPENPSTEPQPLSLSHTLLFSYCRRVHLGTKKEAWTQCKGASFQAGQKKLALAECLCLALVKTSIWIREVNEECSVWEDWYMVWSPARRASRQEFTAVWHALWKLECSHTSEFSSGQHLSRGHAGNIFFCNLSFLSLLLAVCFTLGRAESAEDGKLSYFALFWPPHPWLAPVFSSSPCSAAVFLHGGVALTDLQPLFMRVSVWELLQTLCCEQSIFKIQYSGGVIGQWGDRAMPLFPD